MNFFRCRQALVVLVLMCVSSTVFAQADFEKAKALYQKGKYAESLLFFSKASSVSVENNWRRYVDAEIYIADIILKFQDPKRSYSRLKNLLALADETGGGFTSRELILIYLIEARSFKLLGEYEKARSQIEMALAESVREPSMRAEILNEKGLIYLSGGQVDLAVTQLDYAYRRADREQKRLLKLKILVNLSKIAVEQFDIDAIAPRLGSASVLLSEIDNAGADLSNIILSLGKLYAHAAKELDFGPSYIRKAYNLYSQAIELAEKNDQYDVAAYGYGYIGLMYEDEDRYIESLAYSKKAEEYAQRINDQQSLYQWQWLSARNLWELDRRAESGTKYAAAIDNLRPIRTRLLTSEGKSYRKQLGPLYYQYADYLLRMAASEPDGQSKLSSLLNVRDLLEEIKLAELQDYFKSDCNVEANSFIDSYAATEQTLTLYPVLLEDRVELLLSNGQAVKRYSANIGRKKLAILVNEFRSELEVDTGTTRYLSLGKELYDYLIKPIEDELAYTRANTLVFVPDGPLRTIPISALYDGERFLVEKVSVAVTPGLTLTEISKRDEKPAVFAGGLSEARQGFSKLPAVDGELAMLKESASASIIKNELFTEAAVNQTLSESDFSIAHFATHGEFSSDYSKSFLLTYDGKFTMSELERSLVERKLLGKGNALELLVLSACKTAVGDERAALGLAGVAIQSGAASALASLWYISDAATSELITEFYHSLLHKDLSKSESLRNAQIKLINDKKYKHPSNWAPFLLIGNWT